MSSFIFLNRLFYNGPNHSEIVFIHMLVDSAPLTPMYSAAVSAAVRHPVWRICRLESHTGDMQGRGNDVNVLSFSSVPSSPRVQPLYITLWSNRVQAIHKPVQILAPPRSATSVASGLRLVREKCHGGYRLHSNYFINFRLKCRFITFSYTFAPT